MDQNIIDYIAQNTGDNVREIEGFIAQLKAKESINLKPSRGECKKVSPEEVVKEVSTFYGIPKGKILKKTRNRKVSLIRQIAIYLTRQVCNLPLTKIGEIFGVSDHTSVLYAIR